MNKEKFNELAMRSGFVLVRCMDKKYRLAGEDSHDVIEDELCAFKNLLLDEIIKELQELKLGIYDDGSLSSAHDVGENFGIDKAIRKIEEIKCN